MDAIIKITNKIEKLVEKNLKRTINTVEEGQLTKYKVLKQHTWKVKIDLATQKIHIYNKIQ